MKKYLSIFLVMAIMLSVLPMGASAEEVSEVAVRGDHENEVLPRGFIRDYEEYFTMNKTTAVMEDYNADFFQDDTVTVTFKESKGPTKFGVKIYYGEDGSNLLICGKTVEMLLTDSTSLNVPKGNTIAVTAKAIEGYSGYATFQVSLS